MMKDNAKLFPQHVNFLVLTQELVKNVIQVIDWTWTKTVLKHPLPKLIHSVRRLKMEFAKNVLKEHSLINKDSVNWLILSAKHSIQLMEDVPPVILDIKFLVKLVLSVKLN